MSTGAVRSRPAPSRILCAFKVIDLTSSPEVFLHCSGKYPAAAHPHESLSSHDWFRLCFYDDAFDVRVDSRGGRQYSRRMAGV
jgi:hypothetical protein